MLRISLGPAFPSRTHTPTHATHATHELCTDSSTFEFRRRPGGKQKPLGPLPTWYPAAQLHILAENVVHTHRRKKKTTTLK